MSAFEKFVKFCMAFAVMLLVACGQYTDTCDRKAGVTVGCEDTAITTDSGNTEETATETDDTQTETGDSDDTEETATETGDTNEDTDSGGDTDTDEELSDEQVCWETTPFVIQEYMIDWTVAETIEADWTGLEFVDTDQVQYLDATDSSTIVTIYSAGDCGGSVEDVVYLPDDYVSPDLGDEYHNGLAAILQPDGTIMEINYFASCGDGSYHGWVLPDSYTDPEQPALNACDGDFVDYWFGAHGGSHITATQALQPGELTGTDAIERPLPIEIDKSHLFASEDEADGKIGYRWPAQSADGYYSSYGGVVEDLQMGSILVIPPDTFDCTTLLTNPGQRLCEVAQFYGFIVVDDSWTTNRVSIPMTMEADVEFESVYGFSPGSARSAYTSDDSDYAEDVERIFENIQVLRNPESAWYK